MADMWGPIYLRIHLDGLCVVRQRVAMRLKEILRARKRIVRMQKGEPPKRMPAAAFPLSRNRTWRPGAGWYWWSVELDPADQRCRVLVMLHEPRRVYRAWLGVQHGADLAIMARLEYEPAHPGQWHGHACCEDSKDVPLGIVKHPASRRSVRRYMERHRRVFEITSRLRK